jgi:hypothetical protein
MPEKSGPAAVVSRGLFAARAAELHTDIEMTEIATRRQLLALDPRIARLRFR